MLRRALRALTAGALVATATAALTVVPSPTAGAGANCGYGTRFTGTVSDTLAPSQQKIWETQLVGAVEVAYAATRSAASVTMYADTNGSCTVLCTDWAATRLECTATGTGSVLVVMTNRSTTPLPYTLSARTPFFSGPACDDDRDNDGDYAIDDPADSGCTSDADPLEGDTGGCLDATCYALSQGTVLTTATLVAPDADLGPGQTVRGHLDVYRFPLAGGASLTVACVVLTVDGKTTNPCATAGGTFVSRTATLVDTTAPRVTPRLEPLMTVGVCDGRVTVTIASMGIENFPLVTPC